MELLVPFSPGLLKSMLGFHEPIDLVLMTSYNKPLGWLIQIYSSNLLLKLGRCNSLGHDRQPLPLEFL